MRILKVPLLCLTILILGNSLAYAAFAKIDFSALRKSDGSIIIIGTTNLPDKSNLGVVLMVPSLGYKGQDFKVFVNNGKFVSGRFRNKGNPLPAALQVEVFTYVTKFWHKDPGLLEKIKSFSGPLMHGDKITLTKSIVVDGEKLPTTKPAHQSKSLSSIPNPKKYGENTPERTIANYLWSWKHGRWDEMVEFTQKSWRSKDRNPAQFLRLQYDFKQLVWAKIGNSENSCPPLFGQGTCVDIDVTLSYKIGSRSKVVKIRPRLVREIAPYQPSNKGTWGVNPISAIREK